LRVCSDTYFIEISELIKEENVDLTNSFMMMTIMTILIQPLIIIQNKCSQLLLLESEIKFKHDSLINYLQLQTRARERTNIDAFNGKVADAYSAMSSIGIWTIDNFFHFIGSLWSVMIVLWKAEHKTQTLFIIFIVIVAIILYQLVNYKGSLWKEYIKKNEENHNLRRITRLRVDTGDEKPSALIDLLREKYTSYQSMWTISTIISSIINISSSFLLVIVFWTIERSHLIVVSGMIKSLISSISSIIQNMDGLDRNLTQYELYRSFWKRNEKYLRNDPTQLSFPEQIDITKISIDLPHLTVSYDDVPFSIKRGDKILVSGPSGSGKTTLIKGLQGLEDGVSLKSGILPDQYMKEYVYFSQMIRARMPLIHININTLFNNASPKNIKRACDIVGIWEWARKHSQEDEEDDHEHDHIPYMYEGVDLKKQITQDQSGGEKTRLALAVRLCTLMTQKRSIMVLDEPEQGLDPLMAYEVLERIFSEFKDITILVVSHLENPDRITSWNKKIHIVEGKITII